MGFCPLFRLWDFVLWDSVLWDFVRRDFVLWDFVLWDSVRIPLILYNVHSDTCVYRKKNNIGPVLFHSKPVPENITDSLQFKSETCDFHQFSDTSTSIKKFLDGVHDMLCSA